jgi:hypothetical protein
MVAPRPEDVSLENVAAAASADADLAWRLGQANALA